MYTYIYIHIYIYTQLHLHYLSFQGDDLFATRWRPGLAGEIHRVGRFGRLGRVRWAWPHARPGGLEMICLEDFCLDDLHSIFF